MEIKPECQHSTNKPAHLDPRWQDPPVRAPRRTVPLELATPALRSPHRARSWHLGGLSCWMLRVTSTLACRPQPAQPLLAGRRGSGGSRRERRLRPVRGEQYGALDTRVHVHHSSS